MSLQKNQTDTKQIPNGSSQIIKKPWVVVDIREDIEYPKLKNLCQHLARNQNFNFEIRLNFNHIFVRSKQTTTQGIGHS